jgi:WD40 repeat protein
VANAELHRQVVETARMAAVGETVAGLSHCIKNILQCIRAGAYLIDAGMQKADIEAALFLDTSGKPAIWDLRYGVITRLRNTDSGSGAQVLLRPWKLEYGPTLRDEDGQVLISLQRATASAGGASETAPRLTARSRRYVLELLDASSGQVLHSLEGHTQYIESHAFNRDGRLVVTTSQDGTARVWETDSGLLLMTLRGHTNIVSTAVFSPDSLRILTGSWDGTARIYSCLACRSLGELRQLAHSRLSRLEQKGRKE